jgi:hypothetical protein
MTLPRGLLAAGALFWGWQTGALAAGAALAVLVEAPRWTARRFELDRRIRADRRSLHARVHRADGVLRRRGVPRSSSPSVAASGTRAGIVQCSYGGRIP